jgi:hypothetical protein
MTIPITVFTQDFGPIPGYSTSLYCWECHTQYYNNYYVHEKASTQMYYGEELDFLQVGDHYYIDRHTCELFSSMMVHSWCMVSL